MLRQDFRFLICFFTLYIGITCNPVLVCLTKRKRKKSARPVLQQVPDTHTHAVQVRQCMQACVCELTVKSFWRSEKRTSHLSLIFFPHSYYMSSPPSHQGTNSLVSFALNTISVAIRAGVRQSGCGKEMRWQRKEKVFPVNIFRNLHSNTC